MHFKTLYHSPRHFCTKIFKKFWQFLAPVFFAIPKLPELLPGQLTESPGRQRRIEPQAAQLHPPQPHDRPADSGDHTLDLMVFSFAQRDPHAGFSHPAVERTSRSAAGIPSRPAGSAPVRKRSAASGASVPSTSASYILLTCLAGLISAWLSAPSSVMISRPSVSLSSRPDRKQPAPHIFPGTGRARCHARSSRLAVITPAGLLSM